MISSHLRCVLIPYVWVFLDRFVDHVFQRWPGDPDLDAWAKGALCEGWHQRWPPKCSLETQSAGGHLV
jgi:hypothetical protein